jgi:peptide deformylase
VARAKEVEIRAYDETGKPVTWVVKDWTARVVQHEMDHLRGEF